MKPLRRLKRSDLRPEFLLLVSFFAFSVWQFAKYLAANQLSLTRVVYGIDFNHYYATALLVLRGASPYCVSTAEVLQDSRVQLPPLLNQPTNPPLFALLTAPLGLLPPTTSWALWETSLLLALIGSVWLIAKELNWSRCERWSALGVLLVSSPAAHCLRFAQVQPHLLLLTVLGWVALRRSSSMLCGLCWGAAVAVKFYLWPLLVILVLLREWRAGLCCGVVVAGLLALPTLFFPPGIYADFTRCGKPIIEISALFFPMNFSVGGILQHSFYAFGYPMLKSLEPYAPYKLYFYQIPLSVAGLLLLGLFARIRKLPRAAAIDFAAGAASLIGIWTSPVAWPHYFVFLLFLGALIYRRSRPLELGCILLAVMFLPYSLAPIIQLSTPERFWFAWRPLPSLLLISIATWRTISHASTPRES